MVGVPIWPISVIQNIAEMSAYYYKSNVIEISYKENCVSNISGASSGGHLDWYRNAWGYDSVLVSLKLF